MTEPTLFEMHEPKPEPEPKPKKARGSAGWFPKTRRELMLRGYVAGSGTHARCQACAASIEFWRTPTGKVIPMDPMPTLESPAIAHWSTCTDPKRFRKDKP